MSSVVMRLLNIVEAMPVFRFIVRAQPTRNNPKYATWQPADFIALVVDDDGPSAEQRFRESLKKFHWKILEWQISDQLIDERVREIGGDALQAYEMAVKRGYWYKVMPEHFMADEMAKNPMSPPRMDESFVDALVIRAGGRRLSDEERAHNTEENADYVLDDFIIEGKDIQEERLAKKETHRQIAELFWPYFEEDSVIPIDPSVLSVGDRQQFVEIMARPLRGGIEKSSSQIKATISRMPSGRWKGGVILLNSGFGSLDHDLFEQIAAHCSRQYRRLELIVCITAKLETNGFDSRMFWAFSPSQPITVIEQKLFESFDQGVTDLLNDWGHSGFMRSASLQPPVEPVSFEYGSKTFTWDPGRVPFSFGEPLS